jgi:hypothetical protein
MVCALMALPKHQRDFIYVMAEAFPLLITEEGPHQHQHQHQALVGVKASLSRVQYYPGVTRIRSVDLFTVQS